MRIALFENIPTLNLGGQERSLHQNATALAAAGHALTLCYVSPGDLLPDYKQKCVATYRLASRVFRWSGCARFTWDILRGFCQARKHKWDILYANQYFDTPFASMLSKVSGVPLVCHLRLPCPDYLSRQYRMGINHASRLIAISKSCKETYVRHGFPADKIFVLYNWIDVDTFKPNNETIKDRRRVLVSYFGRICPNKGVEDLLCAFQVLHREKPQLWKLQIVGNALNAVGRNYLEGLRRLAGGEIGRSIVFKPHVADIRPELNITDLVVFPSRWEEPFGRTIIEAMATEVPVVASNVGGIPEILLPRFSGHLFESGNVAQLAALISQIGTWRTTQPELGARCREWIVDHFSGRRYVDALRAIFRKAQTLPR
jgi:glycosyltransferase involved in cell wall biosynthesis